ncbi:MAG TPA: MGMT family protein [Saprospiraceae bacterium]|nr:MGMT family protein [Saprospiraceae bacterium]
MALPLYYQQVYEIVRQIPTGHVTTYGAIADYLALGSARMVGFALRKSLELAPDIPAHRVVNRKGELSGRHYFSPVGAMEALLRSENIPVENHCIQKFNNFFLHPESFC